MAAKKSSKKKSKSMQKNVIGVFVILVAGCLIFLFGVPGADTGIGNGSGNDTNYSVPELGSPVSDDQAFSMHVIDVGQGDAILLSKDGKYALVDAGETMSPSAREAREKLMNYLDSLNITKLEFLLLTHQDYDHIGSAIDVLKKYEVGVVYDNGVTHTSATYEKLMQYILDENLDYKVVSAGDTISSPWDGVLIEVLSPPKSLIMTTATGSKPDINENSIILKITHDDVTYLLTGDAEKKAEEILVDLGVALEVDILKVGHHGSSSSSTEKFLDAVKPKVVVMSLGSGNSYGHPHTEPMERFVERTEHIYRTDLDGDVVVSSDGKMYSVVTGKDHVYANVIVPGQGSAAAA